MGSKGGALNQEGYSGSDFLTETWFIALLGSMVAVMVLLFAAMLLVRRRQLLLKKSTLPGLHGEYAAPDLFFFITRISQY